MELEVLEVTLVQLVLPEKMVLKEPEDSQVPQVLMEKMVLEVLEVTLVQLVLPEKMVLLV